MHKYLLALALLVLGASASAQTCEANFFIDQYGTTATFYQTSQFYSNATWNFSGTTVANNDPVLTHNFGAPGTYNVCLTVTNASGCSDDTCVVVTICGYAPSFSYVVSGQVAEFENTSTGNFTTTVWDFGDGFVSLDYDVIHSFMATGTYNVCLILADSIFSCTVMHCEDVEVGGSTDCIDPDLIDPDAICTAVYDPVCGCDGITYSNPCYAVNYGGVTSYQPGPCSGGGTCQAGFGANINGNTVTFNNTSTGSYTSLVWDFGDGTQSSDPNPVHSFFPNGTYEVCLTISGPGCNSTFCTELVIQGPPQCEAKYVLEGTCDSIVFMDQSTGSFTTLVWHVNGVTYMNQTSVTVTTPGDVEVCLTVSGAGCQNTMCETFNIHGPEAIQPAFTASFTLGQLPVSVTYSGSDSAGHGIGFAWNPGDGSATLFGTSITHVYNTCWAYPCFTVNDMMNCSQTVCDTFYLCDVSASMAGMFGGFQLYPNPGKDLCYLVTRQPVTGNARLVITDVTGRLVEELVLAEMQAGSAVAIQTARYATGCYFFSIVSEKHVATMKWIKE